MSDDIPTGRELLADMRDVPVSEIPEDVGAAEILAEETGKPVAEFTPDPDEYPPMHPTEAERVEVDDE